MPDWTPPVEFDGYRLVRPLGRGGMGQVFLGQDLLLERPVAVKFISALNPDEGQRQRFLIEGRAIARLSHQNVVAIHRVGEVQGHPYFVAEYVRGQALDLVSKPLPWERVLRIARGLARGLAAAHRQGVLHRDLKPSNVVVTESGDAKLLDFGVAKLVVELEPVDDENPQDSRTREMPRVRDVALTHPNLVLGTPRYMAPEVLAGEPATRRSDLFALGVLLYELSAGRVPDRSGGQTLPSARAIPGLNPRLAEIIDRCVAVDPDQRFASADELLDALEHVVPQRREVVLPEGNPYRGLRPFEAEHRALFFGRDAEIRAVLERLRSDPRVVVAGDSGVGKSSLCRAGVLPLVSDGALGDGSWRVVRVVPGRGPLVALARALSPALEVNEEALGAWVASEPAALARALQQARQAAAGFGLLVLVDQAEELFTLAPPTESALVAEALGALGTSSRARVLIAVRGDFVTRLASLPAIGEDVASSLYLLRAMTAEKLREVVVGPARARGFRYESDAIVERLVQSGLASAGALPLLQFALAELWEARDEERKILPAAALDQMGGVEGALSRHADELLVALRPDQRDEVRRILVRLVTAEGTRARRTVAELEARSGPAAVALDALVGARLVVEREIEGESTFELVHEALISGWGTLRDWLGAAAEKRRVLQRLEQATAEWERLGQSNELLWRGQQLIEGCALDRAALGKRETAFLERSREAARRHKIWRALALASVPLVLLLILASAQVRTRQQLDQEITKHLEQGSAVLESARELSAAARRSADEALRLYDRPFTPDPARGAAPSSVWERAEAQWDRTLELAARADRELERASRNLEAGLLLKPSRRDVRRKLLEATHSRFKLAEAIGATLNAEEMRERLKLFDDLNEFRPVTDGPAEIRLQVEPPDALVRLEEYVSRDGRLETTTLADGVAGALYRRQLTPGSYRLILTASERETVRYPFLVRHGESSVASIRLPHSTEAPGGFIYIPRGPYLTGFSGNEDLRRALGAAPLHQVRTDQFWISSNEVTIGEWLGFVEAMPAAKQATLLPAVSAQQGSVSIEGRKGAWVLRFRPSSVEYRVRTGEALFYSGRAVNRDQDWLRFPVVGVSVRQILEYTRWATRRAGHPVRLCTESEWERAARGADGRSFTVGERLRGEDANFDVTYGREPTAMGLDEVGRRPASDSPFAIHDLQGNAGEFVQSVHDDVATVFKGGSWYLDARFDGHLAGRFAVEPNTGSALIGFRLCQDAQQ